MLTSISVAMQDPDVEPVGDNIIVPTAEALTALRGLTVEATGAHASMPESLSKHSVCALWYASSHADLTTAARMMDMKLADTSLIPDSTVSALAAQI